MASLGRALPIAEECRRLASCTDGGLGQPASGIRRPEETLRSTMIDWLYSLPDWALLAFWASLMAGIMVVLPFLTHRIPWLRPSPENSDFVLRLQATLFTITSFVVAFTWSRPSSTSARSTR
jgi:Na+/proline symporter